MPGRPGAAAPPGVVASITYPVRIFCTGIAWVTGLELPRGVEERGEGRIDLGVRERMTGVGDGPSIVERPQDVVGVTIRE